MLIVTTLLTSSALNSELGRISSSAPNSELGRFLSERGIPIGERIDLTDKLAVVACKQFDVGDTLFELKEDSILTAQVAYADREFGRDLASLSERVGPGFSTVALAALVAAERVRGFCSETWFAGSAAETSGVEAAIRSSAWSPVTQGHWESEMQAPSSIDPELLPLVNQGIELVLPSIELAARRAWTPGVAPPPSSPAWFAADDGWIGDAASERQLEGWSNTEVRAVLATSFSLVLSRQWTAPPPSFTSASADCIETELEPAARWGYGGSAPAGPALLPPLPGVLVPSTLVGSDAEDGREDGANVVLGVPPKPTVGSLAEGVCVRCVATRRIEQGETLLVRES